MQLNTEQIKELQARHDVELNTIKFLERLKGFARSKMPFWFKTIS